MAPGPHHQALMKEVGTWETHMKQWMQPGAPPMESTGSATLESLLGGRFLSEVVTSTMMGMPFEGRGVWGFDNATQKHVGTWFDSFGTMMLHFEGTCDGACKVVTMVSDYLDPMTKSNKRMKSVSKSIDADHTVAELYDVAKDGKEIKMTEIAYTRKKM